MVRQSISHYKIIEKTGQGGMGEVYRGRDTPLVREVPIKVLAKFRDSICSITLILFLTAVGLAQGQWRSIGPDGGVILAFAIDPTDPMTLYAGTNGSGLYRTVNAGETWEPIPLSTPETPRS